MKICVACEESSVIDKKYENFCRFHWDCLQHELMIRLRAVAEFGQYHKDNRGPNFLAIYYTGENTLGFGLYLPRTPLQAMSYAFRIAQRNSWLLLRVDIQKTLTDIYVSEDYQKYMPYSKLKPMPYDDNMWTKL
jgi:hypothetical protein